MAHVDGAISLSQELPARGPSPMIALPWAMYSKCRSGGKWCWIPVRLYRRPAYPDSLFALYTLAPGYR